MDTRLVNQKIVLMRKTVPLAIRAIRQKILKTIHQLKEKLKSNEERQKSEHDAKLKEAEKKLKDKLKGKIKQIENLKAVEKDKDYISRLALRHDLKYFKKMLTSNDCGTKENLLAAICSSKQIQSDVDKFKKQNPNCDQWLPEALDLLEKKKKKNLKNPLVVNTTEINTNLSKSSSSNTKTGDFQKKDVSSINNSNITSTSTLETEQYKIRSSTGKFQVSPIGKAKKQVENTIKKIEPKVAKTQSAVIKRLDLSKSSDVSKQIIVEDLSESSDDSSEDDEKKISLEVKNKRKDAFFLNKNGDAVSSDEEEQDEKEVIQPISVVGRKIFGDSKRFEKQNNKFNGHNSFRQNNSFGNRKQFSNQQKPLSGERFERNSSKPFTEFKKEFRGFSDGKGAPGQTPRPKNGGEKLHPSWQAKQAEKNKLQHLSFGGTGANKKIKFD